MLSILIPIYNYSVGTLVQKLSQLALAEDIPFEIICIDDASKQFLEENEKISQIKGVKYLKETENLGRSVLRNKLAQLAIHKYLLFIDTDMQIMNDDYIKNYLNNAEEYDLIYGGLKYINNGIPQEKMLRWKYGVCKEALDVTKRNQSVYLSIKTCNLFIKKDVFNKNKFNTNIREYGHEDTLFCIELQRNNFKVLHIQNPLLHTGIEDSTIYLSKVEIATKNLAFIAKKYFKENELNEIKLTYFYNRLNKMGLLSFILFLYKLLEKSIRKNLLSANPNLILLDLAKLNYYSQSVKDS